LLTVVRLVVVALALAVLTAPSASAAVTETIAVTSRRIVAVAHDQGRVAWITKKPADDYQPYRLTIHDLRTGARVSTATGYDMALEIPSLGLARGRAVFTDHYCGNDCYWTVYTFALRDRRVRIVGDFWDTGTPLGGIAGDGATLAFTEDWDGSQVWRLAGASPVEVAGAMADSLLAASSGRIAAAPGGLVEIRSATSGSLISSFTPAGTIKALGLDGPLAAVLVQGPGGGKRIERYDAGTGAFIASTSITRAAAAELDIAGNRIVFRTGRQIRLLNHATGAVRVLVTAYTRPIGASIEGTGTPGVKRVVWAVNRDGRGLVRSLRLP
jgi:hypothetical protein